MWRGRGRGEERERERERERLTKKCCRENEEAKTES